MTTFTVYANAMFPTTYESDTADEAILAWVRDAGYETVAEAAEVCGVSEDDFLADVIVE